MDEFEKIDNAWMNDETGRIDLCKFCKNDANHLIGAVCTGFIWNGKKLEEIYG